MTDAPDASQFPPDLLAAQKLLHELYAEIHVFPVVRRLPWSVEPLDAIKDTQGWRKVEREASPGWSDEDKAAYEELWRKAHKQAAFVQCHRYWAGLEATDLVRARMKLKHDPAAQPAPVATEPVAA
ncbi:hypothetical protein [Streptomyces sp. NBC_00470]|uniref:hypothetical protein n=1 Tax=Streptomyces sp. NBC_00470 TaxID=2975753 RepID=UPI002F91B45A